VGDDDVRRTRGAGGQRRHDRRGVHDGVRGGVRGAELDAGRTGDAVDPGALDRDDVPRGSARRERGGDRGGAGGERVGDLAAPTLPADGDGPLGDLVVARLVAGHLDGAVHLEREVRVGLAGGGVVVVAELAGRVVADGVGAGEREERLDLGLEQAGVGVAAPLDRERQCWRLGHLLVVRGALVVVGRGVDVDGRRGGSDRGDTADLLERAADLDVDADLVGVGEVGHGWVLQADSRVFVVSARPPGVSAG